jgi:FKBP-type peptidyl-prolyl cis-trans isomerase FkpA
MKNIHTFFMTIILVCLSCTLSCGPNGRKSNASFEKTFDKEASYAIGMALGSDFKGSNIYPDMDEFIKGLTDVFTDSETRYSMEDANMLIQEAFMAMNEKREADAREAENTFLAENSKNPDIHITDSGLQYEIITEGDGPKPEITDTVRVHYEGTLIDGTVFDSSYARGEPTEFPLLGVISGWTEGLQLMNVGSKYRLFIPSDLAYGPQGRPQIPPYSALIFELELLDIIDDEE